MKKKLLTSLILCCSFICLTAQKQGQERIDSMLQWLRNYKSPCHQPCMADTASISTTCDLAWDISYVNSDTALILSNQAQDLSKKIGWKKGMANAAQKQGWSYYMKSDYTAALAFYSKSLSILGEMLEESLPAAKKSIQAHQAEMYGNIGIVYDVQGDYAKALHNYQFCQKIFKELEDKAGLANSYTNIGVVYSEQGNFPEALQNYFYALKLNEQLKRQSSVIELLGNISRVYAQENDYAKALEYNKLGLEKNKKIGNRFAEVMFLANIGSDFQNSDSIDKALQYHARALKVSKEIDNPTLAASVLVNIGGCYGKQKRYTEALTNYFEALKVLEGLGNETETAQVLGNIGYIYSELKNHAQAENYLLQSLSKAQANRNITTLMKANEFLTDHYKSVGNYQKALKYYEQLIIIRDSAFSQEKAKELTRTEMKYDFENKEAIAKEEQDKKDAIAKAENTRQRTLRNSIAIGASALVIFGLIIFFIYKRKRDAEQKQQETLMKLNVAETEMKVLRSQMNPHFIFNALQSIQTFLMSHHPEEANIYLLKFSKLMRLVLENSQHAEVPLKDDMQALELYMQLESIRLTHPFTYTFHIEENINVDETTIPPLILQPFVENAIWHGLQYKPAPGHIDIYISKKNNALYATVEDNGVGRDKAKLTGQPVLMKKESLGMKLTEERLNILNELKNIKARFIITDLFTKSNQPAGTKVELSFPMAS